MKYFQQIFFLKIGMSCAVLFTSMMMSKTVYAGQVVQFTLNGQLESMDELDKLYKPLYPTFGGNFPPWYPTFDRVNLAGASLSGFMNVDVVEGRIRASSFTTVYEATDWSFQLTAINGRVIQFESPKERPEEYARVTLFASGDGSDDRIQFSVNETGYADGSDSYGNWFGSRSFSLTFDSPFRIEPYLDSAEALSGNFIASENSLLGGSYTRNSNAESNIGYFSNASFFMSPVPEPSVLALFGLGGLMVLGVARHKRKKSLLENDLALT